MNIPTKYYETSTAWVKFGTTEKMAMLGTDYLILKSSCYLLFYNIHNSKEIVYKANSPETGDGVDAVGGHHRFPIFGFSEKCLNPRVIIKIFPSFETISDLEDGAIMEYQGISFTESDYVVTLSGAPDFNFTVWNWRTGEKLIIEVTKYKSTNQLVRANIYSSLAAFQLDHDSKVLTFWELDLCFAITNFYKNEVSLPETMLGPWYGCWAPDGSVYLADSIGNICKIHGDTKKPEVIISCSDEDEVISCSEENEATVPFVVWYKNGIICTAPQQLLKWYKDENKIWKNIWSIGLTHELTSIILSGDDLIGYTSKGDLIEIRPDTNEVTKRKSFEYGFKDVCFVNTEEDLIVALNFENVLYAWSRSGELISRVQVNATCEVMAPNPTESYIALGSDGGYIFFISYVAPKYPFVLERIWLHREPITAIKFHSTGEHTLAACWESGKFFYLQGFANTKISVTNYIDVENRVADFTFMEGVEIKLTILLDETDGYRIGRIILVYRLKSGKFDYIDKIELPGRCSCLVGGSKKDNALYTALFGTTKFLKLTPSIEGKAFKVDKQLNSELPVRNFRIDTKRDFIVTYDWGGKVILRNPGTMGVNAKFSNHHRKERGTKKIDINIGDLVITLGYDSVLVLTNLLIGEEARARLLDKKQTMLANRQKKKESTMLLDVAKSRSSKASTHTIDFSEDETGLTWVEKQHKEQIEYEKVTYAEDKGKLLEDIQELKKQVCELVDENFEVSQMKQLDIEEFNLDHELNDMRQEAAARERKEVRISMMSKQSAQQVLVQELKKKYWEPMTTKGSCIKGIKENISVYNCPLPPDDKNETKEFQAVILRRNMEIIAKQKEDYFEHWVPTRDESETNLEEEVEGGEAAIKTVEVKVEVHEKEDEEVEEEEEEKEEEEAEDDKNKRYEMFGSISYYFVELSRLHHNQFELTSFLNAYHESVLLRYVVLQLQKEFNKRFNEELLLKQREVSLVCERNDRLKVIVSDYRLMGELLDEYWKMEFYVTPDKTLNVARTETMRQSSITDKIFEPQWSYLEFPEKIMEVETSEVNIPPYISPSQAKILAQIAAEEERRRLLELADNFRERALIEMMDGVLEVRWEDTLKKDVLQPECMVAKPPEEWAEEDLKAVKQYEEKVKALNSDRERYRRMLDQEFKKVRILVNEGIKKFDESLENLLQVQLQYESAMNQELLKITRMKLMNFKRAKLERKEREIEEKMNANQKVITYLSTTLAKLNNEVGESRIKYEQMVSKDKQLEKGFKREFADQTASNIEELHKFYKKRPKFTHRTSLSASVLSDLANFVVGEAEPPFLPNEAKDYIKSLDELDTQETAGAMMFDEHVWNNLCRVRRIRIQYELKLKARALEIAEAEATLSHFQKRLNTQRNHTMELASELNQIRNDKQFLTDNLQIQLILKYGQVEIPRNGKLSDFNGVVLIHRNVVDAVNNIILHWGKKKLQQMERSMKFRCGIRLMEWEHRRLKMVINDMKEDITMIEKTPISHPVQLYLQRQESKRRIMPEKTPLTMDREIQLIQQNYEHKLEEYMSLEEDLEDKIDAKVKLNNILESEVKTLNVDISDFHLQQDQSFEAKATAAQQQRFACLAQRSKLVQKIHEQHQEILLLQTELELLRLRTYPTLAYKLL